MATTSETTAKTAASSTPPAKTVEVEYVNSSEGLVKHSGVVSGWQMERVQAEVAAAIAEGRAPDYAEAVKRATVGTPLVPVTAAMRASVPEGTPDDRKAETFKITVEEGTELSAGGANIPAPEPTPAS